MIETIKLSYNPVTLWEKYHEELHRRDFFDEGYELRDIGGFYSAGFKIKDVQSAWAIDFLNNGVGRHVEFWGDRDNEIWEGMVSTVTLQVGAATVRASISDMGNKTWSRYQPLAGGSVTRSTVMQHTLSQARFGIKEQVLNGGQVTSVEANQQAQKYLNQIYWVNPELQSISPASAVKNPVLTVNCIGYWQTLSWRTYNQTALTTTAGASVIVAAVIAACGQYVKTAKYEANGTAITQVTDADRRADDMIESICDFGDPSYHLWTAGFGVGRSFYYRQGAPDTIER